MHYINFQYGAKPTKVVLNLERLVWCKQYDEYINVLLDGGTSSEIYQFSNRDKAEEVFREIIKCLNV